MCLDILTVNFYRVLRFFMNVYDIKIFLSMAACDNMYKIPHVWLDCIAVCIVFPLNMALGAKTNF